MDESYMAAWRGLRRLPGTRRMLVPVSRMAALFTGTTVRGACGAATVALLPMAMPTTCTEWKPSPTSGTYLPVCVCMRACVVVAFVVAWWCSDRRFNANANGVQSTELYAISTTIRVVVGGAQGRPRVHATLHQVTSQSRQGDQEGDTERSEGGGGSSR